MGMLTRIVHAPPLLLASMLATLALAAPATAQAASGAPADQALPTIQGSAQVGQALTAHPGTWSPTPSGYEWQWLLCATGGEHCEPIEGAEGPSYALQPGDAYRSVRVEVIANGEGGTSGPVVSLAVGPITNQAGAGEAHMFHLYACRDPETGEPVGANAGWSYTPSGPMQASMLADPQGCSGGEEALYAGLNGAVTWPANEPFATWTFTAPASMPIVGATVWTHSFTRGYCGEGACVIDWDAATDNGYTDCEEGCKSHSGCAEKASVCEGVFFQCTPYEAECSGQGSEAAWDATGNELAVPAWFLPTTHLYFNASCGGGNGGRCQAYSNTEPQDSVTIYASDIRLASTAQAQIGDVGGPLLAGGALAGAQSMSYTFNEPEGPGGYRTIALVDGHPYAEGEVVGCQSTAGTAADGAFTFLTEQPCPTAGHASLALDTTGLPDGEHHLAIYLQDAADTLTPVWQGTIVTLNHPQPPPPSPAPTPAPTPTGPAQGECALRLTSPSHHHGSHRKPKHHKGNHAATRARKHAHPHSHHHHRVARAAKHHHGHRGHHGHHGHHGHAITVRRTWPHSSVRVAGLALNSEGKPTSGLEVTLAEAHGKRHRPLAHAVSGSAGRWRLKARSAGSRRLVVRCGHARAAIVEHVKPALTMRAHSLPGARLRFSGIVKSPRSPARPTVIVQVHGRRGWQSLGRPVRPNVHGAWRLRYTTSTKLAGWAFRFRAVTLPTPWSAAAHTHPLRLRVR